jgi:hypothetical protein
MDKDQKEPGSKETTDQKQKPEEQFNRENVKQGDQLTKEDLPDSTNESTGQTGSGQRQDSN